MIESVPGKRAGGTRRGSGHTHFGGAVYTGGPGREDRAPLQGQLQGRSPETHGLGHHSGENSHTH